VTGNPDRPAAAPQVSVVIPALNAAGTLAVQLAALGRQRTTRSFEVIVADNGSSDRTADVVASFLNDVPGLRLVDASARTGSNVARNTGTAAARGDYVLLCDADDEVAEDWLEALAAGLDHADAVGGRLERVKLNADYIARFGQAWGQPGITTQLGFLPRPIAANAGFRRSVWVELGGFREDYVRGGTETEFYWRLQLAGHTLVDVPDAVVHYRLRASFRRSVRQMYIWGRQHPMLYRDFRDQGMRYDPREPVHAWRWILLELVPKVLRDRTLVVDLCRQVAYRIGRVVGSYRYRVVYL